MSTTTEVTQKDLHDLLEIFERKAFDAGSCEEGTLVSWTKYAGNGNLFSS